MSWREAIKVLGAAGLALALAGCLRPLHGPTASGVPVQDRLAAIEVATVATSRGQERLGHNLRIEIIFKLDGSGEPRPKDYKLVMEAAEAVQVTTVDTQTGQADAAILNATVKYTLTSLDGTRALTTGTARGTATYYRDQQRFASVRAARDAEIRVSKLIAEDIAQRLSAIFAALP